MEPAPRFLGLPKEFWANVRTISEAAGYTEGQGRFMVPSASRIEATYQNVSLDPSDLVRHGKLTDAGQLVTEYLRYRAGVLTDHVQHLLMNAREARKVYKELRNQFEPNSPQPTNNQGKAKGAPRFLTCLVNMTIEQQVGLDCDYNPSKLTAVTRGQKPLRTLARRVDGAYPSAVNPVALWEIKEYYYTTTFGSRVADGVYESLLDGMELEELREHTGVNVLHYLMIDAKDNWWDNGKSYLCRMVDMMHMGFVDEVLFGREAVTRLPLLVSQWVALRPVVEERAAEPPPALPARSAATASLIRRTDDRVLTRAT